MILSAVKEIQKISLSEERRLVDLPDADSLVEIISSSLALGTLQTAPENNILVAKTVVTRSVFDSRAFSAIPSRFNLLGLTQTALGIKRLTSDKSVVSSLSAVER